MAALLTKSVTVSMPAVVLVILWWKRGRITRRDASLLIPFFAFGLVMAAITVWVEKTYIGASGDDWNQTWLERLLIAGRVPWFYAGKLAWPYPLAFYYARWAIDPHVAWQWLFPAALVGLIVALWLVRGRIGRGPLAAVLIFVGVLTPAASGSSMSIRFASPLSPITISITHRSRW